MDRCEVHNVVTVSNGMMDECPQCIGQCPPDCTNTDFGTCPRCYETTALGCNHGPLCAECAAEGAS